MRLSKVQERFKDLMLDHPDALDAPEEGFAAQFDVGRIPLPRRLKVYRNNIVGSLTDLIVDSFPVLEVLVGRDFLEGAARSFILENPPAVGCLNRYGDGFDEFLAGFAPVASLPYLPDVARFEIVMSEAYYAADGVALRGEELAAVVPDALGDLVLGLMPSVELFESDYPVLAIKEFCENGAEGQLDLDQGGVRVMVSRPALEVQIVPLEADEFLALSLFKDGGALGASVEEVMEAYPSFDFQGFLQKHLLLETFAALGSNR